MSLISWIRSEVTGAYDKLEPADMRAELGTLAHGFAANVVYDAKKFGISMEQVTAGAMSELWTAVKSATATALSDPKFVNDTMQGKLSSAIAVLTSDAAQSLAPSLKLVGQDTVTNMVHAAASMVVSGVLGNPTSPPVKSPAVSSAASSLGSIAASTASAAAIPAAASPTGPSGAGGNLALANRREDSTAADHTK